MFTSIDVDVVNDAVLIREDGSFIFLTAKEMEQIYYAWNSALIQSCKDSVNYYVTVGENIKSTGRSSKSRREEIPE